MHDVQLHSCKSIMGPIILDFWKRLNFSMKKDHFSLTGTDLVELSHELIRRATLVMFREIFGLDCLPYRQEKQM